MNTTTATSNVLHSTISCATLAALSVKPLLLDVRTPAEFEEAHIKGSVLHPLSNLDPGAVEKLRSSGTPCVLVCRSGNRAKQAAQKLADAGHIELQVLEGGVAAWELTGLPLERGQQTMSLERQVRIAAGALVFIGSALAWLVSPAFIALPAFVGAGLVFAGITDTCAMGMLIARMPWNQRSGAGSCGNGGSCSSAK